MIRKRTTKWYEQLPEPIRSQALVNFNNYFTLSESLPYSISRGFDWHDSKEGYEYWSSVHYRAKIGEFDSPVDLSQSLGELEKSLDEMQKALDKVRKAIRNESNIKNPRP
ncbi:MAG: hypothetical protein Unbinned1473contig1000_30 [Prokaryotic dsDNA virus sp.]|nr:MAG: hypothetical protein Unbinned1473contig1000_30 [Prokaryotic dsDNA virus sp.]|tara:strand:+ start:199 stop:528 length:330 start_codon:yes stop_codon:yes gene_type:complete